MSASAIIRRAGLSALLAANGESLTYNGATILAGLVNRKVARVRDNVSSMDGKIDFSVLGMSEIEIFLTALATPVVGGVFTDGIGSRHRISYITNSDTTWVFYCAQSRV